MTTTINLKTLDYIEKMDLINEIINNPDENVSEIDVQSALAEMYFEAQLLNSRTMFNTMSYEMPEAQKNFQRVETQSGLWNMLLKKLCPLIDEDTEREQIAERVINVVGNLISFGFIVKPLLKKVVSYFIVLGHHAVCKNIDTKEIAKAFFTGEKKRFNYDGTLDFIKDAVDKANALLENEEFYVELAKIKGFDETVISGKVLGNLIRKSEIDAYIKTYKKVWKWSSTRAVATPKYPKLIRLNSHQFKKRDSSKEWAITLVHEYIHLVDFENRDYYFGHSSNYREESEGTAPYKVEELAKKLIE